MTSSPSVFLCIIAVYSGSESISMTLRTSMAKSESRDDGPGLLVKLAHGELPAAFLLPGMFAGDAVEPAFDAAGEQEIVLVDGQARRPS